MSASASDTASAAGGKGHDSSQSGLFSYLARWYHHRVLRLLYLRHRSGGSSFYVLFFPRKMTPPALLASFATFGVFIAAPWVLSFGHFGDKIGRKANPRGCSAHYGVSAFIIGLLPTYYQIGLWAPIMSDHYAFLPGSWAWAADGRVRLCSRAIR